MNDQFIKEIVANLIKHDRPVDLTEAMAREKGGLRKDNRNLKWKRFVQNSPLPAPQLMKDTIGSIIDSYKLNFARYAVPNANQVKKVVQNFQGMVFSWYTEDPAVSKDDYDDMKQDMKRALKTNPQEAIRIGRLKKLADFIQEKGVKLLQPGENLNDKHLSDCAYAFSDMAQVERGTASNSHAISDTSIKSWEGVDNLAKDKPEKAEMIFEMVVEQNSQGNYMLVARFKTPAGEFVDQPYLELSHGENPKADLSKVSTHRISFSKVMRGRIVPNSSYVYLPDGNPEQSPNGQVVNVIGRPAKSDRLEDEKALNQLKLFQRPDGSTRIYGDMKANRPDEFKDVYQVQFDGPEGGLLVQNMMTGEVFPLSERQVYSMIDYGQLPKGEQKTGETQMFYVYTPVRLAPNQFTGEMKPKGFGPWDIDAEGAQQVRAMFQQPMDELSQLLQSYHDRRLPEINAERAGQGQNPLPAMRHTAGQHYIWVIVSPRHAKGDIVDKKGRGRQRIINPKYRVDPLEENTSQIPLPSDQQIMSWSLDHMIKQSSLDNGMNYESGIGERNWTCVVHDIKKKDIADNGNKRFPHETLSGQPDQDFPDLEAAIKYAMKRLGIPADKQRYYKPSDKVIQQAEMALQAAKGEITQNNIQPTDNTNAAQQIIQKKQKQKQISLQSDKGITEGVSSARTALTVNESELPGMFNNIDSYEMEATRDTQEEIQDPPMEYDPSSMSQNQAVPLEQDPALQEPQMPEAAPPMGEPVPLPNEQNMTPAPQTMAPQAPAAPLNRAEFIRQEVAKSKAEDPTISNGSAVSNALVKWDQLYPPPPKPFVTKPKKTPKQVVTPPLLSSKLLNNLLGKYGI